MTEKECKHCGRKDDGTMEYWSLLAGSFLFCDGDCANGRDARRLKKRRDLVDEYMKQDPNLSLGAAYALTIVEMGEWTDGEKAAWPPVQ